METNVKNSVKTKVWAIDPAHSEIQFKVRHLVISTVTGQFNKFEGGITTYGDDLSNAEAWFSADVESVSTNQPDRDNHLKSADFFDAGNHPKITFKSEEVVKKSDEHYQITGNLTIRGITREVTLNATYGGSMVDPWGNTKAGYELTGSLNRKDFELKWNAVTETGGVVVGDEVKLALNVQVVEEK